MSRHFWNEYGFRNFSDYCKTLIGDVAATGLRWEISGSAFAGFLAFVKAYVYDPPLGVAVLLSLVAIDTLLGSWRSVKSGEKFVMAKLERFIVVIISHLVLLTFSHLIRLADPFTFFWLPNFFFGWFVTRTLLSVVRHMVELKWVKGELLAHLENKISIELPEPRKPESSTPKQPTP